MANGDLLAEFSPSDISRFMKDFIQMMKVGIEIDRYYGMAEKDLDLLIPKYEKLAEKFSKKYKGLKITAKKGIDRFKVGVFAKSLGVKEFFAESASRIAGLKAVGKTGFNQVDVGDMRKFASFLDSISGKIFISYSDPESGTSTVAAAYSKKEKMVEIIYTPVEILADTSAAFRICAYYALRDGFDSKIEVYGDANTFGFFNLLSEIERREWYDRFNPKFLGD